MIRLPFSREFREGSEPINPAACRSAVDLCDPYPTWERAFRAFMWTAGGCGGTAGLIKIGMMLLVLYR